MKKKKNIKRREKKMPHWTEELYEECPELFLSAFEERLVKVHKEVAILLKYLKEQGFKPKNILDLNCGIGRHSVELGKRRIKVLGRICHHAILKLLNSELKKKMSTIKSVFR